MMSWVVGFVVAMVSFGLGWVVKSAFESDDRVILEEQNLCLWDEIIRLQEQLDETLNTSKQNNLEQEWWQTGSPPPF